MNVMLPMAQGPQRECGVCSLCCKVLAIHELDKPKDQWCRHARRSRGCGVYDMRPDVCVDFKCLWLDGLLQDWMRPDKIHGVLMMTTDNENLVIQEDPGWPRHASDVLRDVIRHFIADGTHYVVVVCGESRCVIAREDLAAHLTVVASAQKDAFEVRDMR